ncbi:uncharacterized protein LOC119034506 isoform X1 [Acanthopagrus latus]|uniref:uncharacterized protein LOC119034506 isoform X1 n=1 Tax=Acanthopagrus latus TaxID=8177 RepID=UPI00187D08DD|nr:uncharacterized protein LOC119034506 isoform X1 [Acanthopagrus latus]XP_036981484.1 uncharacterized protein LOC119034506 isoform X1 [Acanthopagrus latus]XP_036981485.1 uncharacterized protein LOC119034506 isoform X1 [Acanthopagrus latus]XP_036981486.1 uncharacterized protein LOC119034506 isoform X1 [Acanthopagrus latus]
MGLGGNVCRLIFKNKACPELKRPEHPELFRSRPIFRETSKAAIINFKIGRRAPRVSLENQHCASTESDGRDGHTEELKEGKFSFKKMMGDAVRLLVRRVSNNTGRCKEVTTVKSTFSSKSKPARMIPDDGTGVQLKSVRKLL